MIRLPSRLSHSLVRRTAAGGRPLGPPGRRWLKPIDHARIGPQPETSWAGLSIAWTQLLVGEHQEHPSGLDGPVQPVERCDLGKAVRAEAEQDRVPLLVA